MTVNSHPKQHALRYERAIRGMRRPNHQSEIGTMATYVRIQSAPIPDVAAYDEWLAGQASNDPRGRGRRATMTGAKLRRMVIMRRNGSTMRECASAIGLSADPVFRYLHALPPELGGEPAAHPLTIADRRAA